MKFVISWIKTSEALPNNYDKILIIYDNEIMTATFNIGISKKERSLMKSGVLPDRFEFFSDGSQSKRSAVYQGCDEDGNNKVPYNWTSGPYNINGQEVEYWAKLPKQLNKE